MKHQFNIVGIRHHAYAEFIADLPDYLQDNTISLCIENDNPYESNAVAAIVNGKHLGYVRTSEREMAFSLIEQSNSPVLIGRFIAWDEQTRTVLICVETDITPVINIEADLVSYEWADNMPTIQLHEKFFMIQACTNVLVYLTSITDGWTNDMENNYNTIVEYMWLDPSDDMRQDMSNLLRILNTKGHYEKANKLQYTLTHMGSPEMRRKQAEALYELSKCEQANQSFVINEQQMGEEVLQDLWFKAFVSNGEGFMGRIWYERKPRKVIKVIFTRIAIILCYYRKYHPEDEKFIIDGWYAQWAEDDQCDRMLLNEDGVVSHSSQESNDMTLIEELRTFFDPHAHDEHIMRFIRNIRNAAQSKDKVKVILDSKLIKPGFVQKHLWEILYKHKLYCTKEKSFYKYMQGG